MFPNATVMIIMDADRFDLVSFISSEVVLVVGISSPMQFSLANPKTDSGKDRMRIMTETTMDLSLQRKI